MTFAVESSPDEIAVAFARVLRSLDIPTPLDSVLTFMNATHADALVMVHQVGTFGSVLPFEFHDSLTTVSTQALASCMCLNSGICSRYSSTQ
jgi:hypothetical protein